MKPLLLLALSAAAAGSAAPTVQLKTSDGWELSASFRSASGKKTGAAVVMLHGLDSSKEEWAPLAEALAKRGVASLAVDMRGHGKSLGPAGDRTWRKFSPGADGEWAGLWKDAEAGAAYLKRKGFKRVGLVGASLGAEAAIRASVRIPDVKFAALLSPVLDPASDETLSLAEGLGPRPLLLAASWPDARSYASASGLARLRSGAGFPADWIQGTSGHGAQMFSDAEALAKIADWIAATGVLTKAPPP